ncbi:MAG TPA: nitronate monooxygenase family protein [Ramlibacter sp.]
MATAAGLNLWHFRGRTLLPVVQGGMGVGISAGGLAGTVASFNAVGTISSVDLRRLHADLWEKTGHLEGPDAKAVIDAANREALDREIRRARDIAGGRGLIAVNVMKALDQYETYVRQALESGADALAVGAGLPLDLPDLAKDFPQVALIPILSDARGVQLLVRKWEKKGRLPDAIVIEHPRLAGGHLGAAKISDLGDRRFDFDVVLPEVQEFFQKSGIAIPLVAAGGISTHEDVRHLQALGAAAVQLGTAFAVTVESDASQAFKEVLAGAKPEDLVEFTSVAGLPARAVRTPWLDKYLRLQDRMQKSAHAKTHCTMWFDCLANCGLRDGHASWGQFCIDKVLGYAFAGDVRKGLFFRGAGRLPFGSQIRPVRDLIQCLMGGLVPPALASNSNTFPTAEVQPA